MLAPVLARLERIAGVSGVRVDCSGTWFLVSGEGAAALDAALPAVRDVLGRGARVVEGALRDAQLAALPRGELWFDAAGIRALSYVEGRVLAARLADAVLARVPLDAAAREAVAEACRAEIFAALDHAHDTGGRASSGWFWEAWPGVVAQIGARLPDLPSDVRAAIEAALRAQAPARS